MGTENRGDAGGARDEGRDGAPQGGTSKNGGWLKRLLPVLVLAIAAAVVVSQGCTNS